MNLYNLLIKFPVRQARNYTIHSPLKFTNNTYRACALFSAIFLISACTEEQKIKSVSAAGKDVSEDSLLVIEAPVNTNKDTLAATELTEAVVDTSYQYPGPKPLPGAILPQKRIIAYYGNPLSKRMGILGELPEEQMLAKLDEEVKRWSKADSAIPVQPALHAIVVTAQGHPSAGGKYRLRMTDKMIDGVLEMAKKRDAIVFLDVQVGQSTLQEELPRLAKYLQLPQVHLGIDAEFAMKNGNIPGKRIGSFDAADINYTTQFLSDLAKEHAIPPKLLIVHRFTQGMITNSPQIKLRPEVQIVMHMDGWGPPSLKKDTFRRYIKNEPVQFTGFKIFYKNDLKNNSRLMTPEEVLALSPTPMYIQYQ